MHSRFLLRSRRVVTESGVREATVVVRDGKIQDVTEYGVMLEGHELVDVGDSVIMPGLVDTHVHINEPGRTEWEGFESATKAAAAGGITTLVEMPLNSSPVTTTITAFKSKQAAAQGKLWVDCGFYAGLIPGNADQLVPLIDAGCLGVKVFLIHSGIDEFPNAGEEDLREAMPLIARTGTPLLVHAELSGGTSLPPVKNPKSYAEYLASRPRQWEHDAIDLMIRLCRAYSCRVHIVHISSADAVRALRSARSSGLPITVETCPHYLFFSAEQIADGDTRFKCAPPIREEENRERLWEALRENVIDFIVSDHSPSTPSLKLLDAGDFSRAWGGIASLQLGLPIVWTEAKKRGFRLEDFAHWMCSRPAEFVGLGGKKGSLKPGCDADIVIWKPEEQFSVRASQIHHRHKLTPYEGTSLLGKVEQTFVRGHRVYHAGTFSHTAHGTMVFRTVN